MVEYDEAMKPRVYLETTIPSDLSAWPSRDLVTSRRRFAHLMNCWPRKETEVDDILLEVRKAREAYAKEFGYDLQAIHRDLKAQEQASGRRIVSLPPRRPKPTMANGTGSRASNVSGRTSG